jgi:hypothetical protein
LGLIDTLDERAQELFFLGSHEIILRRPASFTVWPPLTIETRFSRQSCSANQEYGSDLKAVPFSQLRDEGFS